ncbi:hypothetical protein vBSsoS008_082 [Shigella phage vB_SsoS_008]|nr:hypothetical protein vBSsoS008_082 [Shigella phage vB_SsoS_008]
MTLFKIITQELTDDEIHQSQCTHADKITGFEVNNLYKGRERLDGTQRFKLKCGKYLKLEKHVELHIVGSDEIFFAKFNELKTKTLKCTGLDHRNPMKKSFKVGKRYQVESGRALGGVAGYIFDRIAFFEKRVYHWRCIIHAVN